ncbi:MAG: magnesium transporter [Ruthenibacterium sp.]
MKDPKEINESTGAVDDRNQEQELLKIIQSGDAPEQIREQLEDYHDNDIASVFCLLTQEERRLLYRILGTEKLSDIFAYLDDVAVYIEELDSEKAADIIETMDSDDAVDVLEELDDDKRTELFDLVNDEAKHDITLIGSYSDDEIGSKMTTNFVVIRKEMSVRQAMRALISQAAKNDNISTLYVLNADDTLCGALALKDLIIARDGTELESLVITSYPYVYATETIDTCIEQLKDYSEASIPVLDDAHKVIGVITAHDVVEVVDTEMGEDYAKLGGLLAEEDLQEPVLMSVKKRIPWLIILLFLGLVVSAVVGAFESVVKQLTLIICFQSLILDMAGNVGTQSLAVTIRVLMDENLTARQRWQLVLKEIRVGAYNGLALGALAFVCIGIYLMIKANPAYFSFAVSGCIGISLLLAMIVSSFMGTIIPILFHKLGVDPAVASGPLITTVNDLVAVITYYGLAWLLLLNVLHLAG